MDFQNVLQTDIKSSLLVVKLYKGFYKTLLYFVIKGFTFEMLYKMTSSQYYLFIVQNPYMFYKTSFIL